MKPYAYCEILTVPYKHADTFQWEQFGQKYEGDTVMEAKRKLIDAMEANGFDPVNSRNLRIIAVG